jgi:dTDP-4-dehydrorhamnose 3,5-epimerase
MEPVIQGETALPEVQQQLGARISGVICRALNLYQDQRGWLAEIFRQDELAPEHFPAMAYLSVTLPGVGRGPHAHRDQTDLFCFSGPGDFRVYLWDQRPDSATFGVNQQFLLGQAQPAILIIPPGVVHGYRNLSDIPAMVCNFANRLYRGPGRAEPVDEIRYEDNPDSPFRMD